MGLLHEGSQSSFFFPYPKVQDVSSSSFWYIYWHSCQASLWWECSWMSWMSLFVPTRKKTALMGLLNDLGKCNQWLWMLCSALRKTGWLCAEKNLFLPGGFIYIPTSAFFLVSSFKCELMKSYFWYFWYPTYKREV